LISSIRLPWTRSSGSGCGSAPSVGIALERAEGKFFDHHHKNAEDEHRDNRDLGLAGASADGEHVADALGHADHLRGNDDAPCEAEAGTKAGDKIRDEAGKQDSVHDLPSISAHGSGRVDQTTIHVMHALDGAEQDGEDGADGNDEDSRLIPQTKPEDGDGDPGYAGDRALAAVLAIFAYCDVLIVYMSTRWWRTRPAPFPRRKPLAARSNLRMRSCGV
jgi:hypothetical protein